MDTVAQLRAFPHSKKLRKSGRQRASFLHRSSRVEEVAFCPPCSLGSSNKCTLVPALCRGLVLSLMYKEGSSFQKFCLPTRKQLWVELMLATECCRPLCSTEQIEHHLRFNSAVNRRRCIIVTPFLGLIILPGFHFARCPIPGGHYSTRLARLNGETLTAFNTFFDLDKNYVM